MSQPRYRLHTPQVVAEAIEGPDAVHGEAIIVNLDSGTYYSLTGDTILLWNAIAAGASVAELVDAVAERTGESAERVREVLSRFVASLVEHGLIVERSADDDSPARIDLSLGGNGLLEPNLAAYTDMQDLILLDPVHEVDERGWPHVQQVV